ncbi:iron uptake porin [Gloeobacter violaceus]|uniref:Gll3616 protein n=1 Tax=Gloeobacter violaceus (strain ATCC 29082 / PCC 7421) TaxID=251221 RepID=Q7NFB0_GLOVI|nr:iron uptake porin [Gloeobacter violaceus]BAC91557.1 gll3616 [Gloeobacter violaceus PCC 7421]
MPTGATARWWVWLWLLCLSWWCRPAHPQAWPESELHAPNAVWSLADVPPGAWSRTKLTQIAQRLDLAQPPRFEGDRPLNRLEFADWLQRILVGLEARIASEGAALPEPADLAVLERLRAEFQDELGGAADRLGSLETRLGAIEANLLSPVTKMDGSVVMGISGGVGCPGCTIFSGTAEETYPSAAALGDALGAVSIPIRAANTTFVSRTTLNLRTTFTGQDELRLRMRGVTGQDISAALAGIASGIGVLIFSGGPDNTSFDGSTVGININGTSSFTIDEIRYIFPLFSQNFRVFFGPRLEISEYLDANSFANNEELDFTGGLTTNSPLLTFVFFGPGLGFDWDISETFSLRGIYLSTNAGAATGDARRDVNPFGAPYGGYGAGGLFGGESSLLGEFEVRPGPAASVKLQFGQLNEQGGIVDTLTLPETIQNTVTQSLGVNFEWSIIPAFAIFGRYGWGTTAVYPVASIDEQFTAISLNTWQLGFTLPNLGGDGNALGFTVAQPLRVFSGSAVGLVGPGLTSSLVPSGTERDYVVYYRHMLTDRLSLTPILQFIEQPVNSSRSNGLAVGILRAVFSF